ncbi:MAG: pilus assembly protein [Paracoccaceae bacterium]
MLTRSLLRFARDNRGVIGAETVIVLSLMIWVYIATIVYFSAFRMQNTNLKAAYTVADMLSRQTIELDADYLDGMKKVFDYLNHGNEQSWIRVTSFQLNIDGDAHEVLWSYATGSHALQTNSSIASDFDRIPVMAQGDTAILVETFVDYVPLVEVAGVGSMQFQNFIVTRARFAPRIDFDDGSTS